MAPKPPKAYFHPVKRNSLPTISLSSSLPRSDSGLRLMSPRPGLRPGWLRGRCLAQPRYLLDDAGLAGLLAQVLGALQQRRGRRRVALQQGAAPGAQEEVGGVGGTAGPPGRIARQRQGARHGAVVERLRAI